jgi:hypothetical protein
VIAVLVQLSVVRLAFFGALGRRLRDRQRPDYHRTIGFPEPQSTASPSAPATSSTALEQAIDRVRRYLGSRCRSVLDPHEREDHDESGERYQDEAVGHV